ncbi:MAG: phosphorylase [Methylococcaceae bacterium]|nr:phosphorylase [Methylococcaceae bacterium]
MITGIIVALPEELRTLSKKKISKGHYDFISETIIVAYSGAGATNAAKATELLISKGATRLISWGCAGALAANLKAGDLMLPESLLTTEKASLALNQNWQQHTAKLFPESHSGSIIDSVNIIANSDDKKSLHQQSQANAVDMESAAITQVCQQYNLPCLVIRTIADPVEMSLPQAVSHAMNAEGEVILSKLLSYLLTHPQQIPALIRLGIHFNAAQNKLKAVANHLDTIVNFDLDKTA